MTKLERFVTEGNEKADELAKAGAMLDEGLVAEARAEAMKQEWTELYEVLQHAASFHCLLEEWKEFVMNSSRSRKKSGLSLTRRVRERSIKQSGVRKQTDIDV